MTIADQSYKGSDLSGGHGVLPNEDAIKLGLLESKLRLLYRTAAMTLAAGILLIVACAFFKVVNAFVGQINRGGPVVHAPAESSPPVSSATVVIKAPASVVKTSGTPASEAATSGGAPVTTVKADAISIDLGAFVHAMVAVITVLLVALVVLAIGLVRATFTLRHASERDAEEKKALDSSVALPGSELLKAAGDALSTVLKGLPGGKG